MNKEELLKQVYDALTNGKEFDKIKVKYQTGEVIKFDFEDGDVEVVPAVEEAEEEETVEAEAAEAAEEEVE